MFVGIDWATDAHEVCAVDASGKVCHRATIPTPRTAWTNWSVTWAAGPPRVTSWWESSGRKGGWWTGSWRPATRSC